MYECWIQLRNELIFEAAPWNLEERCESVCRRYRKRYKNAPEEERREAGQLLKELAVDLCSYLPRWNMKDVSRFVLESGSKRLLETAAELGGQELVSQAEEEKAAFADSRLIQMTELKENKKSGTAWGNDNALGIMECMRKGASFVTTNPPIVNTARKEKPEEFDRVRDEINRRYPDEPVEKRVSRFTLEAVLNNCRALRSVYRLTGAKEGYVNYQVNPKNFEDSEKMIQEIEFAYEELSRRLNGKPNVVFKVPGTAASLETVRQVTAEGIGVNITVDFAVSQMKAFADVIEQGIADKSFVTVMAGRLDGPVAEDLKEAGVENADVLCREASRLVTKRAYEELLPGYKKTELLVASLRGPWNFDASLAPGGGASMVISAFPDKAGEFDGLGRGKLCSTLTKPVDENALADLEKSETFRKAYEPDAMKPEEFAAYGPVQATLSGFISVYEELEEYMAQP
ncbi:MAG TPA: hypothetical protein IAB61_03565 [Candidatus Merdisoma merdipullorum]|nr:hypothetical protein [Candidatus Merdisoma merdipullorum]